MSLPNLLLYLVLAAPGGPTCLDALLPSIGAQDWATVVRLGAIERERDTCAIESEFITYNMAVAWERLGEAGEEGASCRSHALYLFVAFQTRDADIERASRDAAARLQSACSTPPAGARPSQSAAVERTPALALDAPPALAGESPATLAPATVDGAARSDGLSIRGALFIAAGASALAAGGLYLGATSAQLDKDVAAARYVDALGDVERDEAAADFEAASARTDLLGYSGIGLGVVAVGIGLTALLMDEEPGELRVGIGLGQMGVSGRF